MKELEIILLHGIGKLKLGMNQEDLRAAAGSPASNVPTHTSSGIEFPDSDYFLDSAIQQLMIPTLAW